MFPLMNLLWREEKETHLYPRIFGRDPVVYHPPKYERNNRPLIRLAKRSS